MTGKSTKDLIGSLTAGQASSPADMNPTKEQVLEGLLADRPSPEKGDAQQAEAEAERASPSRPGDDAGTGRVNRNQR
eukprot:7543625-Alexandrium_andersonii.AAC.1